MRKLFLILMTVLACTWTLSAQTKTIRGKVLDAANNEPLIGATVMPIGGGQGCQANIDGEFTLTVPAKVTQAKFTYVGYTPQTVALKDGMTVYMASSATSLDDVVVVAYGTANKESLTGSVAVVGADQIEERPITSATAALEGNAPGVQVNNAIGTPGQAPTIRVRGFSSITGSNTPLYVVDGMPFEGSISDINPADVESISVLKDAASCALYGNKGSNGVILITTKKAKQSGKVDVSLSINLGSYTRGLPKYERLGTNDWMEAVWTGAANQLLNTGWTAEQIPTYLKNNIMGSSYIPYNVYGVPGTDVFDANGKVTGNPLSNYNDLDWWDAISRTGFRQEYGVNAAGATEKFNVFASLSYLKENGYVLATDFERFTGRLNANFTPTSYFRFGINLNANYTTGNQNDNAGEDTLITNPFNVDNYSPIYPYYQHDEDGVVMLGADGKPLWNTDGKLTDLNIAWQLRLDELVYTSMDINGTAYGTVILPYGFDVTVRGNMWRRKTNYVQYSNNQSSASGRIQNGVLYNDSQSWGAYTFMQQLNWSHEYGDHHIDVLLDHENFQTDYSAFYGQNNDQSLPGLYVFSNFLGTPTLGSGAAYVDRTESYLGRARYNYQQKYFGELSFRRDGSSRFAKENRWGNFWSIGASWIITKEKFMNELTWVNYAKLRMAYGTVGNNASASLFNYLSKYGMDQYWGAPTFYPANLASNNLKWETTKSFDIALEGSLFDDRFNFSIGYFDKRSTDLIFNVTMPRSAGSVLYNWLNPTVTTNIGTMSNRGWELSFGVDILRTRDFKWNFTLDATFLSNKIIKLPYGKDIANGVQRYSEGRSIYEYFTQHFAGVDQMTGKAVFELDPNSYEVTTGAANFESLFNGAVDADAIMLGSDGQPLMINGKYYVYQSGFATRDWQGTALPTVYGSFGTNFQWKGLSLGMLFTYSLGGKTYDSNYQSLMSVSDPASLQGAMHKDVLKGWTAAPEGMTLDSENRVSGQYPQLNFANAINNNGGDRWLTSSDYLVFKNLNITYSLPKNWVAPLQLQSLAVGFSVDNLFTVTARKGMNPQESFAGGVSKNFVTARVFSFSVKANF